MSDEPKITLENGSPVTSDHREINPASGMQKGYIVLSAEERAKGFVRPVRDSYIHTPCGTLTKMSRAIAERYRGSPSSLACTSTLSEMGTFLPVELIYSHSPLHSPSSMADGIVSAYFAHDSGE